MTAGQTATAVVTGWAAQTPDGAGAAGVTAARAAELLGRKGLLAKEPATRLALCAVHRALRRPNRSPRPSGPPDPRTAVVVSSNLGNTDTVARVVRTVAAGGGRDVSVLDAPNASSNVIASSVAIWFRFAGPNLMVCSGATGGLDAIGTGLLLLRSGRAERVVVAGAEPDDETAAEWFRRTDPPGRALRAAAACVVLERPGPDTTGIALEPVRSGAPPAGVTGVRLPPSADTYGAAGVLDVAVAADRVTDAAVPVVVCCGDRSDGHRWTRLAPWPERGPR